MFNKTFKKAEELFDIFSKEMKTMFSQSTHKFQVGTISVTVTDNTKVLLDGNITSLKVNGKKITL